MARVLSRAFQPAIAAIDRSGGSIVSFGGDALFSLFQGESAVRRAQEAAQRIGRAISPGHAVETSVGPTQLSVTQAVHFGAVAGLHLGSDRRRHYVLAGAPVNAVARLQARVERGRIQTSPAARSRASGEAAPHPAPQRALPVPPALEAYLPEALRPLLGRHEGEFRRCAILFVESRGSGGARLEPFVVQLWEVLDRCGGVLLKSDLSPEGIKWLCAFGLPEAHEDDDDRAARAALELLARPPRGLEIRAGIDSGLVVNVEVGTSRRRSFDVLGDVVNSAARALAAAGWGEILATAATRAGLHGVESRALPPRLVKGKAAPMELHALLRAGASGGRVRILAPLVGREAEMSALRSALSAASSGAGCVVGVRGDAGLGKSRLKWELVKEARSLGFDALEGRAPSFGGTPYAAVGGLLRQALGLPATGSGEREVTAAVEAAARALGLGHVDRLHLAAVLGGAPEGSALRHLAPREVRLNNTIAMRAYLLARARERPQLLVLEDMHWSDELSRELVASLAGSLASARMLVLLLYRPGYLPPASCKEIDLPELDASSVDRMLGSLLGDVPPAVGELVRRRSDGNPLFVEEVVRHLLDSGILGNDGGGYRLLREVGAGDVPESVEALIKARIDRLSPAARRTAQVGAVVGRRFDAAIVARAGGAGSHAIEELVARELASEDGEGEYVFKHALTRDVAYATILGERRRRIHRAVARALEATAERGRGEILETLGHHWEAAGDAARARSAYLAGARAAVQRYAHESAERLYRAHLRLTGAATAESVVARNELGGKVLLHVGRTNESLAEHLGAEADARALGERGLEAASAGAAGRNRAETGRPDEAEAHLQRALGIYEELGDAAGSAEVVRQLGLLRLNQGRVDEARQLCERALALARAAGLHHVEATVVGQLGLIEFDLGRMDEARATLTTALALHRAIGERVHEGVVLGNLALLASNIGEGAEARRLYGEALAIHREVGNRRFEGIVLVNLAVVATEQGNAAEAMALYEKAIATAREVDDRFAAGVALANLGTMHIDLGAYEKADEALSAALVTLRAHGNQRFEGIVVENVGLLRQRQGRRDEARRLYDEALRLHLATRNDKHRGIVLSNLGSLELDEGRLERAEELFGEALAIERRVRSPGHGGVVLDGLAAVALARGRLEEARERADEAIAMLEDLGRRIDLGLVLCTRGHVALACGESATEQLHRARDAALASAVTPLSELALRIEALASAQATFDARPRVR